MVQLLLLRRELPVQVRVQLPQPLHCVTQPGVLPLNQSHAVPQLLLGHTVDNDALQHVEDCTAAAMVRPLLLPRPVVAATAAAAGHTTALDPAATHLRRTGRRCASAFQRGAAAP